MMTRTFLVEREHGWCLRVNRWCAYRAVRLYFKAVSRLGDGVFWYAMMAALAVAGGPEGLHAAAHMAVVGGIAAILYRRMKGFFRRARPCHRDPAVRAWVAPLDEFSFPSGHTLHAVSFTLVALAHFPGFAPWLLPFTASIAASRVVLGVHYPSDVLAATAIGTALAGLALWVVPGVTLFA
jgi:undecaprenyl-diphosphatase